MQKGGDRVITVIKTLGIRNASLHVITAGKRKALARFEGKIEIREEQNMVPVLGRACKGEKRSMHHLFCAKTLIIVCKMNTAAERYMRYWEMWKGRKDWKDCSFPACVLRI